MIIKSYMEAISNMHMKHAPYLDTIKTVAQQIEKENYSEISFNDFKVFRLFLESYAAFLTVSNNFQQPYLVYQNTLIDALDELEYKIVG